MDTSKMLQTLTVRVPCDLLMEFEQIIKADKTHNANKSNIVRSCVEAYIQLAKRANGRQLPPLEFKGFEQDAVKDPVMSVFPIIPPRQVKTQAGMLAAAGSSGKIRGKRP